jgi:cytochrome oxidase Cu insertion factor (SCO1/SenC/PrrC family)
MREGTARRWAERARAALAVSALAWPASALAHEAHDAPPAPPARFEAPLLRLKRGELALISFVYLQCGETCPLATAMLHRLDGELAQDPALAQRVELVTVSFDPQRDTPQQMRALRERLAPRGRWRFLTAASASALRPVLADFGQDAVWIPGGENAPDSLRHVLKVFVVDSEGAVRQIYSTGFLDVRLVLADLRTLLLAR